ncbi:hypothetical protein B0I35DRAFT_483907 [Stachybotrys elegans]|uniref:Uncharacterized protein n=1 Tax=Stachybotrys elegans TaxID=80388 RepID=A0A8K0SE38_9HYPO|nr:hypothetical protein B0I35DRAFT_483907 [Stachybotrys elegans]
MKFSTFVLAPATLIASACAEAVFYTSAVCKGNGNNCQRGIGGVNGRIPLASRIADCSSLFTITVTPAATTTVSTSLFYYATTTVTVEDDGLTERDVEPASTPVTVLPTSVPTYATYCAGAEKYYSACQCAGVTPATTTAPTPVVTSVTSSFGGCTLTEYVKSVASRGIDMIRDMGYVA